MDIGEILAFRIGVPGEIAHARTVDSRAIGKVAESHAHRLDAIPHRQQTLHVVVGNDDGHPGSLSNADLQANCELSAARRRPISALLHLLHRFYNAAAANATAHAVVMVEECRAGPGSV